MRNKLISVIIPIYNVEKYVKQCLDSVVNQTYKNLEIICVDDCGTDNSMQIVEEYAKNDNRIKILNYTTHDNKGVSFARNYGIENATGEYIYLIDSDDFIEKDYIEAMYSAIEQNNVDVVVNANVISYTDSSDKRFYNTTLQFGKVDINNHTILKLPAMVWCKLYKKSFLDKINVKFPISLRFEDEFFHYATLVNVKSVYLISGPAYFYRQNQVSFMLHKRKNVFDSLNIIKLIYEYYRDNGFLASYALNFSLVKRNCFTHTDKLEFFKLIKEFFLSISDYMDKYKYLYPRKHLIFFYCVLNSNNYYIFKIKYILSKIFRIDYAK